MTTRARPVALRRPSARAARAPRVGIARACRRVPLEAARIRTALCAVAQAHGWTGGVSLAIGDDAVIASLHGRFLRTREATDVLAFAYGEDAGGIAGEIIVSAETAARTARALGEPAPRELLRYCVHGMLHLCGFDDGTPRARRAMHSLENRFLPSREEFTL
jgi:probable rRNA maturation factor